MADVIRTQRLWVPQQLGQALVTDLLQVTYTCPVTTLILGMEASLIPPGAANSPGFGEAAMWLGGPQQGAGYTTLVTSQKDVFVRATLPASGNAGGRFIRCRQIISAGDAFTATLSPTVDNAGTLYLTAGIVAPVGHALDSDDAKRWKVI